MLSPSRTSSTSRPSFFKQHKYHATRTSYGGVNYPSKLEAGHAALLDTLRKAATPAERVVDVKRQIKVSFDYHGVHITNYYCDFVVTFADGHVEWHETKGFSTNTWAIKERLFRAFYPDRQLVVIRG